MESPGNELRIMTPIPGVGAVERGFEMIISPEEPVLFEAGVLFLTEWSNENAVRALKELQHGNK